MIKIENIHKRFGKHHVLRGISIDFEKGRSVALIGPNGSGKTTLIKCLLGMVKPDEGDILFGGESVISQSQYRQHIGYMPQIQRFPEHMKVSGLFKMMQQLRTDISENQYDWSLYRDFEIDKMGQKQLGQLSGGMKQKVSAALAFLFNPDVLVLDEPTAGLDPISNEVLKAKLKSSLERNKGIIITSHILSDLDEITTDVAYLMEGNIAFFKTLEQLRTDTSEDRLNRVIAQILQSENHYV